MKPLIPSKLVAIMVAPIFAFAAVEIEAGSFSGLSPGLSQSVKPIADLAIFEMPNVDVAAYRVEDAERARSNVPTPVRFAAGIEAAITPAVAGFWEILADGSVLWRVRIASPGALSLNLGLDRFELPTGAALWLYSGDGTMVQGPYTRKHRNAEGGLWTAVVLGDELVRLQGSVKDKLAVGDAAVDVIRGSRNEQARMSRHEIAPVRGRDSQILLNRHHNATLVNVALTWHPSGIHSSPSE